MSNAHTSQAGQDVARYFYRVSAEDFKHIPGSPIAYWISDSVREIFLRNPTYGEVAEIKQGLATADDDRFLRHWYEVPSRGVQFPKKKLNVKTSKWYPFNKGGEFRKWFGNQLFVVNWENDGEEIKSFKDSNGKQKSRPQNISFYFRDGVTWGQTSSGKASFRYVPKGYIFAHIGSMMFSPSMLSDFNNVSFLNSPVSSYLLEIFSQTMGLEIGHVKSLPADPILKGRESEFPKQLISISEADWDSYETSWDFNGLPLLEQDFLQPTLKATYQDIRAHWCEMTQDVQQLEEENNRIFIDAYGLQDELTPDVPLEEITLACNPYYRYGNNKSEEELEALLLADAMRDLVSYAVGCMFGRYALEEPGLILANQGETIKDYLQKVPEPSFPADEDNVIPMLDGDWFTDDITERFREFLRIAFGEEHYEENLRFVEQALGKDIRKYFLKDFYNDHVRRYKKRPIYWLFSSPKGSFNALIYMHRYQPHTVGTVLEYLRDFKDEKLQARKNHLEAVSISAGASEGEKTKALKEIEKINKILAELDDYERDVLYPLATEQVEIDLDDGVKANYPKFGDALRKITGLSQ